MGCHLLESFLPHLKILDLPMLLKICHLDVGIQDDANDVDAAFIEILVPLSEIIKATLSVGEMYAYLGASAICSHLCCIDSMTGKA